MGPDEVRKNNKSKNTKTKLVLILKTTLILHKEGKFFQKVEENEIERTVTKAGQDWMGTELIESRHF